MATKKNVTETEVILATGEATGHAHRARGAGLALADGSLSLAGDATITHEEHATRVLPALPAGYDVRKVLELDPAGDVVEVTD